jgi:hypothetical protein
MLGDLSFDAFRRRQSFFKFGTSGSSSITRPRRRIGVSEPDASVPPTMRNGFSRGGNIGLSMVMTAPPILQRWTGSGAAPDLQTCLWVACYARGQLGSCGGPSFWLGLEPGRKFALPLGLLLWYHGLWQRQVWYQRKNAALRRQAKGFKSASGGTPPSLPQLMLGSQRRATKPLTAPTRSGA